MYQHDTPRRVRVGTVTRDQLAALLAVLAPYRAAPVSPAVMELAKRVAGIENGSARL